MPVDIGSEAINRATRSGPGYTILDANKLAAVAGVIETIEVWAESNIAACYVGTFEKLNGNVFKCRDSALLPNVVAGAKRTFTEDWESNPLAIAVEIGDYLGVYYISGYIERDSAGAGYWLYFGQAIEPGVQTEYTFTASRTISVGGYISLLGWTGKISGVTNPAKIMGVAVGSIHSVKGIEAS